jgi:hypothetical protein
VNSQLTLNTHIVFSEINVEPFVEYHCGTFNSFVPTAWKSKDCESTLPYICKKYLNHTDHEIVGKCFYCKLFLCVVYLFTQYAKIPNLLIIHDLSVVNVGL